MADLKADIYNALAYIEANLTEDLDVKNIASASPVVSRRTNTKESRQYLFQKDLA